MTTTTWILASKVPRHICCQLGFCCCRRYWQYAKSLLLLVHYPRLYLILRPKILVRDGKILPRVVVVEVQTKGLAFLFAVKQTQKQTQMFLMRHQI